MRKYINARTVVYVLYTVLLFVVVYVIDITPDHRDGGGDYSLWCKYLYLPVLMTYHGLMSGVILRYHRIWTPLAITAIISLIEGSLTKSVIASILFEGVNLPSQVKTTCYYLIFTAVGFLVIKICRWLFVGIGVLMATFKDGISKK